MNGEQKFWVAINGILVAAACVFIVSFALVMIHDNRSVIALTKEGTSAVAAKCAIGGSRAVDACLSIRGHAPEREEP